jgi:hypothetical protein
VKPAGLVGDWAPSPVVQVGVSTAIVILLRLVALVGPMASIERAQILDKPLEDFTRGDSVLLAQVLKLERDLDVHGQHVFSSAFAAGPQDRGNCALRKQTLRV